MIKVGVMVPMSLSDGPGRMPTWADIRRFAQHAEQVGLDSVWVCDHLLSEPPGGLIEGIHEGWSIMAALAASTARAQLGQLVTCASFRNPALLAKMAATADGISGGRLTLGLGAGWYDREYESFGYPTDRRVSRFEDALRIIGPLLRGETVTFAGRFHQVNEAELLPPPDRPIPILIAAKGPRMLGLTARHADAWNTAWYDMPDDRLRGQMADLDAALEGEGRDPATLRRTVGIRFEDPETSAGELARALDAYDELGFADAIVGLEPASEPSLDRLAEAILLRARG